MSTSNYTPIDPDSTGVNDLIQKYKKNKSHIGGGYSKESAPIVKQESNPEEMQEVVEHKPEEEVSTFVTPKAEIIDVPPDLKHFGLQPVTTTQFPSYQNIKLPISDEKITVGLHAPITSSLRWLAVFAVYLLQQAHLGLKTIHGKVIRVVRS